MFKTRRVIAEIFSIVGVIRQQCTWNLLSEGHTVKVEPAPATGLESSCEQLLTMAEHDAEKAACPHCGSHEVEQRWSAFSAVTSKKSA
jgi:Zn finger protein HypA/HybF involved in hydrogenase expression